MLAVQQASGKVSYYEAVKQNGHASHMAPQSTGIDEQKTLAREKDPQSIGVDGQNVLALASAPQSIGGNEQDDTGS